MLKTITLLESKTHKAISKNHAVMQAKAIKSLWHQTVAADQVKIIIMTIKKEAVKGVMTTPTMVKTITATQVIALKGRPGWI